MLLEDICANCNERNCEDMATCISSNTPETSISTVIDQNNEMYNTSTISDDSAYKKNIIGQISSCSMLNIGSLNVCSLRPKLQYPEFCEKLHEYDIFGVLETKTDKYDVISVDGYEFIQQDRKQKIFSSNLVVLVFL